MHDEAAMILNNHNSNYLFLMQVAVIEAAKTKVHVAHMTVRETTDSRVPMLLVPLLKKVG